MKLFSKTVLIAFALSAASGMALAQTQPGGAGGTSGGTTESGAGGAGGAAGATSFSDLDKDGDGYISSEEAAGVAGMDMQAADTDGDGRLSRTEFEAAMPGAGGQAAPGGTSGGSSGSGK